MISINRFAVLFCLLLLTWIHMIDSNQIEGYHDKVRHSIQLTADSPSSIPSQAPTVLPPTPLPSAAPTVAPTVSPTKITSSLRPTASPSTPRTPTRMPTYMPSSRTPTRRPTTAAPSPATFAPTDPYFGEIQMQFESALTLKGLSVATLDKASIQAIEETYALTLNIPKSSCKYKDSVFSTTTTPMNKQDKFSTVATTFQVIARVQITVLTDYSSRDSQFLSMRNILLQASSSGALQTNLGKGRDKYSATSLNVAIVNGIKVDTTYKVQDNQDGSGEKVLSNTSIVGIVIGSAIAFAIFSSLIYSYCCIKTTHAKIGIEPKAKDEDFDFPGGGDF